MAVGASRNEDKITGEGQGALQSDIKELQRRLSDKRRRGKNNKEHEHTREIEWKKNRIHKNPRNYSITCKESEKTTQYGKKQECKKKKEAEKSYKCLS